MIVWEGEREEGRDGGEKKREKRDRETKESTSRPNVLHKCTHQ